MLRHLHLGVVHEDESMAAREPERLEAASRTTGKSHSVIITGDSFISWGENWPDHTSRVVIEFDSADMAEVDPRYDRTWLFVLEGATTVREYLRERQEATGLNARVADYAVVTDAGDKYPQMYSTFLPTGF